MISNVSVGWVAWISTESFRVRKGGAEEKKKRNWAKIKTLLTGVAGSREL